MSIPNKVYLGDSVYAEMDPYGALVLTTWNGYTDDPRNVIVLEPEVIEALQLYLRKGTFTDFQVAPCPPTPLPPAEGGE